MYKGKIISDWSRIDFNNRESVNKMYGAMQAFFDIPNSPEAQAVAEAFARHGNPAQAFTATGDFPAEVLQAIRKYHQLTAFDRGYEQVFDILDFTGTRESGFYIDDVISGLSFNKVEQGDKARVYKMSGARETVTFDLYGGALQWLKVWFDDNHWWTIENTAAEFRNKAFSSRASNFYALIDAVAATYDQAWRAVEGAIPNTNENYVPLRDIRTINQACTDILSRCRNLFADATADAEFIILAPVELKERIPRALGLVQQSFAGSTGHSVFNVRPIYTTMLTSSSSYYVILPKRKMLGGYRMDLTLLGQPDVLAYADLVAGWLRYGGAIAETKQLVRCATSAP